MMISQEKPHIGNGCFVADSASLVGAVELQDGSSVWFNATIRADEAPIAVGFESNIQDNAVLHVSTGVPLSIGNHVTVGHGAILHSCTIEDGCLIGMGAIVLDHAVLAKETLVGAGALVTEGKTFPPRTLVLGSPAKAVRPLTEEELTRMRKNADHYAAHGRTLAEAR